MHAVTAIAGVTEITTLAVFKVNFLPYQFNNEMVRVINVLKYTADSNESCIAVGFYSGHSLLIKFSNVEKMVKEHHKHPIFVYPPIMEDEDLVIGRFFFAGVRDIQFHPKSSDWLSVLSGEGACFMQQHKQEGNPQVDFHIRFQEEILKAHDRSDVESLCFSPNGEFVASLGMNGSLGIWYVSLNTLPSNLKAHREWVLIQSESLGTDDPFDSLCRPFFLSDSLLVLSSQKHIHLRHIQTTILYGEVSWLVTNQEERPKYHTESIVAFTSFDHARDPSRKFLIAAGRDNRISLWRVDPTSNFNFTVRDFQNGHGY